MKSIPNGAKRVSHHRAVSEPSRCLGEENSLYRKEKCHFPEGYSVGSTTGNSGNIFMRIVSLEAGELDNDSYINSAYAMPQALF